MNTTETVLLYLGTLLVASEMVSSFANLASLFTTAPLAYVLLKYLPNKESIKNKLQVMLASDKRVNAYNRALNKFITLVRNVLFYFVVTIIGVIWISAGVIALVVLALIFILSVFQIPNIILNKLYLNLIRKMAVDRKTRYVFLPILGWLFSLRPQRNTVNTGDPTSRRLEGIIRASVTLRQLNHIPFNAYLGIVLITTSFIMELLNK